MASDAMRAEFEKEVLRRYPNSNLARSQDGYAHTATHSAVPMTYASIQMLWEVWQAARRTPAAEVAGSSDSSMPVVAWCDLSNPLNNEAFAWPGTLRPATHTCALYTAPPPTAEVEDAITSYLEARDALDNREYAGINGEPWDVLQRRVHAARKDLDAALQSEAQTGKPGGSHEAMAELNQAREQGLKARGG